MSRCDVVAAHVQRRIEQCAKLNVAVADNARVGRQPLLVGVHKALDNTAVEGLLQVEHMMGYPQTLGDRLRVGDVAADLTHARDGIGRGAGEAHGGTDTFVALAFEQVRGHAGIDAAAHGDEHALVVHGEVLLGGMWPKKKSGAGGWFRAADIVASSDVLWDALMGWAQTAGREETGSSPGSTYGRQALVLEERRGQVALAGVGKQGHDGLALVLGALG